MSDQEIRIAQIRAEHERQNAIEQMAIRLFEQSLEGRREPTAQELRALKRQAFKAATIFYELPKPKK